MYNYDDYMRNLLGYPIQESQQFQEMNTYQRFNTQELYNNQSQDEYQDAVSLNENRNIENMYPEIYHKIYPMVKKACTENMSQEITQEMVDGMAYDIYFAIEDENSEGRNSSSVNSQKNLEKTKTSTVNTNPKVSNLQKGAYRVTNLTPVNPQNNRKNINGQTNSINSRSHKINNISSKSYEINNTNKIKTELNRSNDELKNNPKQNTQIDESRQRKPKNSTLFDLVRILILRELLNRPRPPRPHPRPPRPVRTPFSMRPGGNRMSSYGPDIKYPGGVPNLAFNSNDFEDYNQILNKDLF